MIKSKKGFTLIELLAVIIVLLAISVMAVSSISAAIERNKTKQDEVKKRVLESYAEAYYQQYKAACVTVGSLKETFKLEDDEIKNPDGDYYNGVVKHESDGTFKYYDEISNC